MTLRKGQRVVPMPMRSWMSFVNAEQSYIAVGLSQNAMRHVQVGQRAEVTLKLQLKLHPGRVFGATVAKVGTVNPAGQLEASGQVPPAPSPLAPSQPFGVLLALEPDSEVDVATLPGGAAGYAAIYTDHARSTHVIRRVMVRMEAWLNYVRPW